MRFGLSEGRLGARAQRAPRARSAGALAYRLARATGLV